MNRVSLPLLLIAACAHTAPRAPAASPAAPAPVASAPTCPTTTPTSAPAAAPVVPAPTLADLGLYRVDDVGDGPTGWAEVTPLAADEVAPSFDNLDDLGWLVPVAKANKVVLFGESHYLATIHHLAHRVLFALERGAHFGFVSLELPYSLSGYLDYYAQLDDDAAAARFAAAELDPRGGDVDLRVFLDRLRAWNHAHPDRRIHIGAHDLEHDEGWALERVLAPYLHAVDPDVELTAARYARDPDGVLADLDALVARARRQRVVGAYPFLTAGYAAAVVANLRALRWRDREGQEYFRQAQIVRNLTDPAFHGRYLRTGKAMIWGGAHHTRVRPAMPDGGDLLREGTYLAHDFAPTRGKVYAIAATGIAVSPGAMADVDAASLGFYARTDYGQTVATFARARRAGLLDPAAAYLRSPPDMMASAILALGRQVGDRPFRIVSIAWPLIDLMAQQLPPEAQAFVAQARTDLTGHDALIIVPRSPLAEVRGGATR